MQYFITHHECEATCEKGNDEESHYQNSTKKSNTYPVNRTFQGAVNSKQ